MHTGEVAHPRNEGNGSVHGDEGRMPPGKVADHVFQAIRENRFYILTHPEFMPLVQARLEAIAMGKNPPPLAELMA